MATNSDPDTLPTPNDPSGPCPRCGRHSNFTVHGNHVLRQVQQAGRMVNERADFLSCNGCGEVSVVVTERFGNRELDVLHVYPAPGSSDLDRQVNPEVASAYGEGLRCLSIGANRAAAVMFRSALSLFVKDKGGEEAKGERHLKTALKHMKEDGSLHSSLWEWADHLNQIGNEGAHPEDYDDVTAEEADSLGHFVRHLIRHEYELPAQLLRARGLLKDDPKEEPRKKSPSVGGADLSGGLDPTTS